MSLLAWSSLIELAPHLQEDALAWATCFGVNAEALAYRLEDDQVIVQLTTRTFPVAVQALGAQLVSWTWLKVKTGQPERVAYNLRLVRDAFELGLGGYVHCPAGMSRDQAEPHAYGFVLRGLLAMSDRPYPVDRWPLQPPKAALAAFADEVAPDLVQIEISRPTSEVDQVLGADSGGEPEVDDQPEEVSSHVSELLMDEDEIVLAPVVQTVDQSGPGRDDRSVTTAIPPRPDPHAPTPPYRPSVDTPPGVVIPAPLPPATVVPPRVPAYPAHVSGEGWSSATRPFIQPFRQTLSSCVMLQQRDLDKAIQRAGLFPTRTGPRCAVNLVRLITLRRSQVVKGVMDQLGWTNVDEYSEEGRIVLKRVTAVLVRVVAAQGPFNGDCTSEWAVQEYLKEGVAMLIPQAAAVIAG